MKKIITSTDYFNPNGEGLQDEKLISGTPTGFIDMNHVRYGWSKNIYDLIMANTWFPSEVDTTNELKNFKALTQDEKDVYQKTFAQLAFNDVAQEEYLLDFRRLANNRMVKSVLTMQASQEVNHTSSYAVLLDAAGNSDEVFSLYKTDTALARKNDRISEQFAQNINGSGASDMLLSAMASVNLEGIYFLSGFGYIYTLGDKVGGARDMIQFIARDELNTHLPLFANIFKTIRAENNIDTKVIDRVHVMISDAVEIELEYAHDILEGRSIAGLSKDIITDTVHNFANERLRTIGLSPIFPSTEKTTLQKLVAQNNKLNSIKTNFFEGNVANYSKGTLDIDDF